MSRTKLPIVIEISATEPADVAITGVPQARASIITRPNGSGPLDRVQQGCGGTELLELACLIQLADVLDAFAEHWLDLVCK